MGIGECSVTNHRWVERRSMAFSGGGDRMLCPVGDVAKNNARYFVVNCWSFAFVHRPLNTSEATSPILALGVQESGSRPGRWQARVACMAYEKVVTN